MTHTAIIPVPPATNARIGWTLYRDCEVIGWIRRAEQSESARPAGTFWTIPRYGCGDPAAYMSVQHAAQSPFLSWRR